MNDLKLNDLKIAQATAEGALKGHVSFMLISHRYGAETEKHWNELQRLHDEVESAQNALCNHLFGPVAG